MVDNTSSMFNNREYLWHNNGSASSSNSSGEAELIKEQDRLLPIANVGRIMKKILPPNAKISKEAKQTMQECVTEFICFVTGEASDRCEKEKRRIVNADNICWALESLGFDNYAVTLQRYMQRYRKSDDPGVVNKYVEGRDEPPSRKLGFDDQDNNSFPRRFALPEYLRNNTK